MPAVEIPQDVKWAVFILYASLGIGVFQTVVYASEMSRMTTELLVHCLAWVVIYRISKGRNWARILYLILLVFTLLSAVGAALHGFKIPAHLIPSTIGGMILSLTATVADIVAMILLFGKPASRWFDAEARANIRAL